jgi:geranylgeranyl reductase family protein
MAHPDVLVVGGGPAGSAAAWRAATAGARVVLLDKASFPRDKPCGDGLTPRAVRSFEDIGLGNELKRFHRVDRLRVFGAGRRLEFGWPATEAFPDHGYVIARTDLDDLALRHAATAGADVREDCEAFAPLLERGTVVGVRLRRNGAEDEMRAAITIAADGASSRLARALGMTRDPKRPIGVAVRAHFESDRPEDDAIESYLELRDGPDALPGYGWVFPMGGSRINVGVGILSTYKGWRDVNTAHLMDAFMRSLPATWGLPAIDDLKRTGQLKGWRLPMGFAVSPPWRPGLLAAGDAAGVVNPFNGEGISEAVESGVAAVDVALRAIAAGGPTDLSQYERLLDELWGPYYRLGRTFVRLIGNPRVMRAATVAGMRIPPIMSFAFKVLANLYREQGGSAGDRTVRAMLALAGRIRAG